LDDQGTGGIDHRVHNVDLGKDMVGRKKTESAILLAGPLEVTDIVSG
jgi:hypothetical protein